MTAFLSRPQVEGVRSILMSHRHDFARAVVFGSRARGDHRRGSDLDLAILGAAPHLATTLFTEFIDSDLPIAVDVVDFDRIANDVLRAQIVGQGVPFPLDEASSAAGETRASSA